MLAPSRRLFRLPFLCGPFAQRAFKYIVNTFPIDLSGAG